MHAKDVIVRLWPELTGGKYASACLEKVLLVLCVACTCGYLLFYLMRRMQLILQWGHF